MPRRLPGLTLALLTCLGLLFGCGDQKTTAERKAEEGHLIINNTAEPATLDPQVATGTIEARIICALFEGLVSYDPVDLHPVPGVAERWELSPDGRTWTFHLRASARWSNGDAVTSGDFLFSFRRMLTPSFGAEYASMLHGVRGAKDYNAGKTKDFGLVGFRAPDPRTLVIELEHPIPYFLQLLCHHSWLPVHPPTILRHGTFDQINTPWTRPGALVGNGPFALKDWQVARRIVVTRSPTYWNAGAVALNSVEFRAISDLFAEERAFRGGELHVTGSVPPYKVARLREQKAPQLRLDPYLSVSYVWINQEVKGDEPVRLALRDVRVRRALGMVVDRQKIVEKVLRAGESPALHITPPGTGGYVARARWSEDVDAARRLLAEAGYPGGRGLPKLEYLHATGEGQLMSAQALQEMWRDRLGVRVELRNYEWKVYLQAVHKGEYQLARGAWAGDYNDPNTFLEMFMTGNELNQCAWSDAEFDRLMGLAARENDAGRRMEYFQRAEERLVAGAPVIPVAFNKNKYLIRPEVKGWYPTLLDMHPLGAVRLEPVKGD